MYKGDADWKPIAAVKNNPRMHIPVFGNGDVNTPERVEMRDEYGLRRDDRSSEHTSWWFSEVNTSSKGEHLDLRLQERVEVARRHLEMAIAWKGES
jgi:tRNA-dihydrouridine synthase